MHVTVPTTPCADGEASIRSQHARSGPNSNSKLIMGSSQSSSRAPPPPQQPRGVDKKQPVRAFRPIPDRYETIEEVQRDLRKAGLESSNLIIGIDYTESNTSSGKRSFGGRSLHEIDPKGAVLNPYQRVISAIARVLEPFDDDNIIPTYGFGDHRTGDKSCFELFSDGFGCNGLDEVLERYNKITPLVKLWGPTSFAPLIREAIETVKRDGGYHILVIIADGQLSKVEPTRDAIIEASKWPISIIMVGVGDGPWDMMEEFDDKLPTRRFDNFQFVDYGTVMKRSMRNPDAGFAMAALMEVPEQYRTIRELGMLDH